MTDRSVVLVLNRDLMFGSRISSAVKALGMQVRIVKSENVFRAIMPEPTVALGILDMNTAIDWEAITTLIANPEITVPIIGFGPHVDVEGRRAAKAAGLRRIFSNGEFSEDIAAAIRRYAVPNPPLS